MQENESSLPSGFRAGKAAAGGDCFFDSFRQGLEETKSIDVTVKALRGMCKDFASKALGNPSDESYNWFRNAIKGKLVEHNDPDRGSFEDIDQYVREICESKVWGDSDIEGRILCGHYSVKLYVAEMQKGADKYNYVLVDSEGVHDRGLDPYGYDASDTIRLVNQGTGHFEPVLRKQNSRGSDEPLNDLKKDIEGYLGESFHFANIFADSKGIYLGYSNNQNGTKEERLKFAVLTNEKDSQDQQIVRCYTISRTENISGSRFSEGERVLMKNALPSGQSFAFKEHKMFIRKDGGLVCKPFSKKQEFPKNVKGPCNRFEALNVPFSPPHTSTPITRRNIPRGHDKAYAYKFLEDLLKIEMSPDVLVDIIVDSKDDTKIAVVGRPKVLGSSTKQMRHVIPYSSIKSAIESAVKVKEKGGYILHVKNMVEQVMTPLIISREGLCLTEGQYDQLRQNNIISSDEHNKFKLTTKTKKGQRNRYHLIYDKEIIETINKEKIFTEEEIKEARTGFNARLRQYISHGIDYLTDGLAAEDINTVTIMCEGVARIILTMFNQDIHAAFPEEGNTLSEEIRLYESQNDAKEPKAKVFSVLLHDEITQEIVEDYNLRIRIVNNEGYIVKRTACVLSVLNSLLKTTSYNINEKESKKYLDDYNEKCNSTIRTHSQDLGNYNGKINKNNLNDVLYNHVAKHLYEVFDFKPLEKRVLAPRREAGDAIKVYPSAGGIREAEYLLQEGDEYRRLKINEAKGYNDKAIFRSGMANKLIGKILSSKIVSHVIIHLVPYRYLKDGFMESAVEEGLGNGMQEVLNSFINLVQQDYINAPFHERIGEVLNDDWVNRTLEKYQEQNQSFSEASSIIVDESHTKKLPGEGGIDGSDITELPKEGVVTNIEQLLKGEGVKEHIHIGGYMKKRKSNLQMAFEEAHSDFLCDAVNNNNPDLITQWVENNLMKGDDQIRGGKTSRTAFYEAEKSLMREYILEGKFDNIVTLLDAIHNEKFKSRDSYKELKIKECEVLTGAIVMARGSLERDDTMHKNLNDLLKDKQEKLKKMEDIDLEKDGVSTKITEALDIVRVNSAGSSKGK
ncbi:OTU domain-containing protein [Wolbachia endosymbiont (group B) of Melanostoma mellinum]|uniref:hypothetical protein n=1 Tax=Wolbachia endosymbiont (group B) of Melanostoma mellinum TaxID=2954030 RepID=UPI0022315294|nr:hypothetical protein [Wolbachia endosymbiont (group B) of Melanostoma mellinum]